MQSLNPQFDLLGRLISASEMRHKVISHNIANVNTPDYQRLDVEFEQQLSQELARGQSDGHRSAAPEVIQTPGLINRADGNNVDIDREIGQLNKNALLQQVWLQLLTTEMNQMRTAIES
ncbi:MAG: flagellar basal body rod protein FlgB [Planctomycetaceae bacterium]|nr:flagellar basal body rod protein FlgB [Planctomycetaceae bacterium]